MIENIRKYSGLMIVVFVILFISFFFMDTGSRPALGGGGTAIKIDGRSYSQKEVQRLGSNSLELVGRLAGAGDFGLYQFLHLLSGGSQEGEPVQQFFVGRMLLRHAQEDFGIYPGEEEISDYIRTLRAFAGPDGAFDAGVYKNFVENHLGRLGMTEGDLRELASDVLISRKLNAVIGAGLGVDRQAVAASMALDNQQIDLMLAKLDLDPFVAKIEPTEEQIRGYWELIQDSFVTPTRRKFSYVMPSPTLPELPEETPEETPEEVPAEGDDETQKAAQAEREEKRAADTAKIAEERRRLEKEFRIAVDDFLLALEDQQGEGFEKLAAEAGWEVKTTDFFPANEPPAELDVELRASGEGKNVTEELFKLQPTPDPISKISDAMAVGENSWIVARLDAEELPRVKTFAEARDEARAQYIDEEAMKAMKAAGEEAIQSIREALAAGKSFAEAAAEAGLSGIKEVEGVTRYYRPEGESEPQNLFQAARVVDPGSVADLIVESDRAFVLYVAKREVVREENAAARLDAEVQSQLTQNETIAFLSWLNNRIESANVEVPQG